MTLSRIAATGRGRLSARLVIEGLGVSFVSAKRMEKTETDGRVRVEGLVLDGLVIGATADIMRCTLEGTSLSVRINDMGRLPGKRHGRVTQALIRSPSIKGYINDYVSPSATSIELLDATDFPSSGVAHIGTEAIAYDSITGGTTLTDCTRGLWNSIAQAHYMADGEGLADAQVTDYPHGIEGRRVLLYLYGDGDDPQGDGSLRWRGVCATDARWTAGYCEVAIDPVSRVLSQALGGDLSTPVKPRGIHYTSASPWGMLITELAGTGRYIARVRLVGFYETQAAFIASANAAIATELAASSVTIGDGAITLRETVDGYDVMYRTDSAAPRPIFCNVQSQIDFAVSYTDPSGRYVGPPAGIWESDAGGTEALPGDRSWTPDPAAVYFQRLVAPIPRATLGRREGWDRTGSETVGATADYYRLYFGGLTSPGTSDAVMFGTGDDLRPARVNSIDAPTRSAYIADGLPGGFVTILPETDIYIGRSLGSGDVLTALTSLIASSPTLANAGAVPLIGPGDFSWGDDVDNAYATSRLAQGRGFYLFEGGTTIGEILAPELTVLGCYMRIGTTGGIEIRRLTPPLTSDAATASIDDSAGFGQTIEKSPNGVLSTVVYRVGYDPVEGEWAEHGIAFRDVQTVSVTRSAITLEIAQRSTDTGHWGPGVGLAGVDRTEVARVAIQYLGLFGMPTAVVTVPADARYMDVRIGDVVSISSSILPDIDDGVSPIADRVGMVLAKSLDLGTGAVSLAVLMHTQRFAGYSPAFRVTAQTDNGGDEWEVTVNLSDYTDETDLATWLAVGDLVRVSRADDTTADVTGEVVSFSAVDQVVVQLDATWTPGADEWCLRSQESTAHAESDSLGRFAFVANSSKRLARAASAYTDAQVFA